jgi:hypothetical protein
VVRISAVRRILEWKFRIQASHDPKARATRVLDVPTCNSFPSFFLTPAQMVDWITAHPAEASQRFWCNALVLMGCSSPSLAREFLTELDRRLPSAEIESFMAAWVCASPDLFVDDTLFFYPILTAFPRLLAPYRDKAAARLRLLWVPTISSLIGGSAVKGSDGLVDCDGILSRLVNVFSPDSRSKW